MAQIEESTLRITRFLTIAPAIRCTRSRNSACVGFARRNRCECEVGGGGLELPNSVWDVLIGATGTEAAIPGIAPAGSRTYMAGGHCFVGSLCGAPIGVIC